MLSVYSTVSARKEIKEIKRLDSSEEGENKAADRGGVIRLLQSSGYE